MVPLLLLLAASVTVQQDGAALRSGCDTGDSVLSTVKAGTEVSIRFAMNGSAGACYKVAFTGANGEPVSGYLPASALAGLDDFNQQVRSAPVVVTAAARPAQSVTAGRPIPRMPMNSANQPLVQAASLLEQNQPRAALEILEQTIKTHGRDYQTLVAAGVAAYRSDQARLALDYLEQAEQIQPDLSVQQLIARLRKETAGDKSGERLYGTRFLLRYEGGNLDADAARSMVALLEQEYSRISSELGCRTDERIVTVVQSKEAFRASTDAAEWSAGMFDGARIRVPVIETASISPRTREVLAHELVHACLANLGTWPTWLHEGIAQKLSGATLGAARRNQIRAAVRANKIPRLGNMTQTWSRLSREHASIAYDYALAAADVIYENYRDFGIRNIFRNPEHLAQITADIDRRIAE